MIDRDMKAAHKKLQRGFTLIELLVVIGILAVLLAITLIAINPAKQFEQANNTQRASDVNAILNAVWQYAIQEQSGDLTPLAIPTTLTRIGSGVGQVNLCPSVAPDYIAALPLDPQIGTATADTNGDGCPDTYDTGYDIMVTADGRVTVTAPRTEPVETPNDPSNDISVTR